MKTIVHAILALCALATTCRAQTEHVVLRDYEGRFDVDEVRAYVGDTITIYANSSLDFGALGLRVGHEFCNTSHPVATSATSYSHVLEEPGYIIFYGLCARPGVVVSASNPPGGCCLGDGACVLATGPECQDEDGRFFGAFTTCQAQACCPQLWFVEQPQDRAVDWGQSIVLSGTVSTAGPVHGGVEYRWLKNGLDVHDDARIHGATTGTLLIEHAKTSDMGTYLLVARTECGDEPSLPAEVGINCTPPAITAQPAAYLLVDKGAAITLKVKAMGHGKLKYQWYKDGVKLKRGKRVKGVSTATLLIKKAKATDAATYTCVVIDDCGTVTTSAFRGRVFVR